jgi:hypothetical protein
MIIPQKYTDGFILWCVTIAAFTVAVSKFIYRVWIENDVNNKIASFLYTSATITRNVADVVVNETSPNQNAQNETSSNSRTNVKRNRSKSVKRGKVPSIL